MRAAIVVVSCLLGTTAGLTGPTWWLRLLRQPSVKCLVACKAIEELPSTTANQMEIELPTLRHLYRCEKMSAEVYPCLVTCTESMSDDNLATGVRDVIKFICNDNFEFMNDTLLPCYTRHIEAVDDTCDAKCGGSRHRFNPFHPETMEPYCKAVGCLYDCRADQLTDLCQVDGVKDIFKAFNAHLMIISKMLAKAANPAFSAFSSPHCRNLMTKMENHIHQMMQRDFSPSPSPLEISLEKDLKKKLLSKMMMVLNKQSNTLDVQMKKLQMEMKLFEMKMASMKENNSGPSVEYLPSVEEVQ